MKISYNWLKTYLDFNKSPEEVADAVTQLGLEVEETAMLGVAPNPLLVVGEVLSKDKHPNSDKLSVCMVDAGQGNALKIVCGAQNYKVGDRVPVALVGCKLPNPEKPGEFFEIKAAKLRGVESQGMMCATDEIGLGGSHADGLMILTDRPKIGALLNEVLPSDTVFEIKATPNRPDALSHLGIARDLAAKWNLKLKNIFARPIPEKKSPGFKGITIENLADCPHYRGYIIRGVNIGPSPAWLQELLKSAGLRPICNIVDITNFICLGLGQPLHSFDLEKIGGGELRIRRAKEGETLALLDGTTKKLDSSVLVIADAQKPLVMAGIMGGKESGVTPQTTDILLEAAQFNPALIRKTVRKKGVSSDSSYRFERGIDPQMVQKAAEVAVELILEIAGGKLDGGAIVAGKAPCAPNMLEVSREFIVNSLGFEVGEQQIKKALMAFGFKLKKKGRGNWEVTVPSFRLDISRPVDLVEEVLRFQGVDSIPTAPLVLPANEAQDAGLYTAVRKISHRLVAQGYNECLHYTLRGKQEIEYLTGNIDNAKLHAIENPLSADMAYLRFSLVPGLMGALELNRSRGNPSAPLFEAGHVFRVIDGKLYEFQSIAFVNVITPSPENWRKPEPPGFFEAKALIHGLLQSVDETGGDWKAITEGALWQPYHSAELSCNGITATAGVVHFEVLKREKFQGSVLAGEILLPLDAFEKPLSQKRYVPFSQFPPTRRDVAVIVDAAQKAGNVEKKLRELCTQAIAGKFDLESVNLFDLYQGKGIPDGKKSLAFALTFRAADRTLTDDEVNAVFNALATRLKEEGLAIRG